MKKITFLLITLMAIGTFAMGETYPADGPKSYKALHDDPFGTPFINSVYLGLGYTYTNTNINIDLYEIEMDIQGDALTVLMGYNIYEFLAIEGRYSHTIGDLSISASGQIEGEKINEDGSLNDSMSNIALYLKPMYSSGMVTLYGLIGGGYISLPPTPDNSGSSFQWGVGMSWDAGDNLIINSQTSFFIDYVRLNDSSSSNIEGTIDAFTVGLTFQF